MSNALYSAVLAVGLASACPAALGDQPGSLDQPTSSRNTAETREAEKLKHHEPDLSGQRRTGKASFYAKEFAGKPMANGSPMDPQGDNAASKTLPLGTTAKVTNLETGKSAVVTIQDRGPYVPGRIVDLSPKTARQIGITARKGVARVAVAPIVVPQPDGGIKLGAAARERLREQQRLRQMLASTVRPNPSRAQY
jgi:rare lipoprotein A